MISHHSQPVGIVDNVGSVSEIALMAVDYAWEMIAGWWALWADFWGSAVGSVDNCSPVVER